MVERQEDQFHQIDIGVVVPALICAPIWLAEERGFLADEQLKVRLHSFGTTEGTTAGLRDGIVPIAITSQEGSILDALTGGDLRLVAGFVNRPPLSMIAQPKYRAIADLRGATLGTTSLKEGTCHLMERMMAAHGLHQPKDFQFVIAGAHPQRWKVLQAGTLDAAIQLVPFNYIAEEAGFSNLGDVDEYVPNFLFAAVCARISWADENFAQMSGLLRALHRGVLALYDDPDGAAEIAVGKMDMNREHARRACRGFVSKAVFPKDLSIDPLAFAATIEAMEHNDLMEKRPRPSLSECADLKFLASFGPV
jgi:ABC-type nitrate/sulfonate/bicarbonate transport system substrate-binding protein